LLGGSGRKGKCKYCSCFYCFVYLIEVDLAMRKHFEHIRNALEEHLSSINENTTEIQSLFDYLHQLEIKVEKLSQRLDRSQLNEPCAKPQISPLNKTEREVFLALYTEEIPLTIPEIALRVKIPISLARENISSICSKGIPLHRSHFNNQLFLKLAPEFKEMQAKQNFG